MHSAIARAAQLGSSADGGEDRLLAAHRLAQVPRTGRSPWTPTPLCRLGKGDKSLSQRGGLAALTVGVMILLIVRSCGRTRIVQAAVALEKQCSIPPSTTCRRADTVQFIGADCHLQSALCRNVWAVDGRGEAGLAFRDCFITEKPPEALRVTSTIINPPSGPTWPRKSERGHSANRGRTLDPDRERPLRQAAG